jgi:hypothetical protein
MLVALAQLNLLHLSDLNARQLNELQIFFLAQQTLVKQAAKQ